MNLVLGNLTTLKQWLLPESWQQQTARDTVIASLGLGVAGAFETFCDRRFLRTVGDTEIFRGDVSAFVVRRFPLESAPTLAVKHAGAASFTANTDLLASWRADNGLVELYGPAGDRQTLLQVTFTGGYWINSKEDDETADVQPGGSTALPSELQRAWLDPCRHLWTAGKLFANTGENSDKFKPPEMELTPMVRATLNQYRRITL